MEAKEYNVKTQTVVNFLTHIFSENIECVARTVTAQAEQNTNILINMLELVRIRVEDWIQELKAMGD